MDRQDDLRDYLNGRKPLRRLANILRRLPGDSHYVNAKRNDPQLAAALAQRASGDDKPKFTPPPTEWTTVAELLAAVFDRLGEVVRAVQNGYAREPIREPIRPYPRPITEIDRAKKRAEEQEDQALEDLIAQAQETHRRQLNREG